MNANSPVCASAKPCCTDVLTSSPVASAASVLFVALPTRITAETSRICGRHCQNADGSTISPIDTKKTAEYIVFSGPTRPASRCRTSLDAPMSPQRNAPSASEKWNR